MSILCYRFLSCYRFFLTVLLLYASCAPIAFSCESAFSPGVKELINFVREKDPQGERFGEIWEQRISEAMKARWTVEDVRKFLNAMKNRIGVEDTLKRIQTPSYFFQMDYKKFIEMVSVYEEYLGVAGVNQRLRRSLNGFHRGNAEEVRAIIAYLATRYFDVETSSSTIQAMMLNDLSSFSEANRSSLEEIVEYLKGYIVGANPSSTIKEMMEKSFIAFSRTNLRDLKPVVEYLKEYFDGANPGDTIQAMMKQSFIAFSRANLRDLKPLVEYLEGYIVGANPRDTIQEMMRKSFIAFSRANLKELVKVVGYLENLIGKEKVKAKLQADFNSFSSIKLAQLEELEKKWGPKKMKQHLEYNLRYLPTR